MEVSKLHFYSWGLVANNKSIGETEIKVVPIEYRFGAIETVIDNPEEAESLYESDEGGEVVRVYRGSAITAKWMKYNSNRITAPDVRRNDQVMIWRLGETDMFYWSDMNISNVKRLETVVYAWSADPKNPIKEDLSNAYYLELSTHNKTITLATSQANGEPFGYTIQLDTDYGSFQLIDSDNNTIYLDSVERIIGLQNSDLTEFRIDKKNIYSYAPDSIYHKAENTVHYQCTDFILDASKSITFNTTNWKVDSSASISFSTTNWNADATKITYSANNVSIDATKVLMDTPDAVVTGLLTCGGLSVGGAGSSKAGGLCVVNNFAEFKNGLSVNGGISADTITCKTLKATSASFDSHGPH